MNLIQKTFAPTGRHTATLICFHGSGESILMTGQQVMLFSYYRNNMHTYSVPAHMYTLITVQLNVDRTSWFNVLLSKLQTIKIRPP